MKKFSFMFALQIFCSVTYLLLPGRVPDISFLVVMIMFNFVGRDSVSGDKWITPIVFISSGLLMSITVELEINYRIALVFVSSLTTILYHQLWYKHNVSERKMT